MVVGTKRRLGEIFAKFRHTGSFRWLCPSPRFMQRHVDRSSTSHRLWTDWISGAMAVHALARYT